MIVGSLDHPPTVIWLARERVLREAFAWISRMPADPGDGITELGGPDFYVNVHRYPTRSSSECRWESHRHTIDLQYVFEGGEGVDCACRSAALESIAYEPDRDFESWPADVAPESRLTLRPGRFVLLLPGELHRPMLRLPDCHHVRKLVFKIQAHLLPFLSNAMER